MLVQQEKKLSLQILIKNRSIKDGFYGEDASSKIKRKNAYLIEQPPSSSWSHISNFGIKIAISDITTPKIKTLSVSCP